MIHCTYTSDEALVEAYRTYPIRNPFKKKNKGCKKPKNTRINIYNRDNGICYLCNRQVSLKHFTLDHVVPLAKGGTNRKENLKVAHRRCNLLKKDMLYDEYIQLKHPK